MEQDKRLLPPTGTVSARSYPTKRIVEATEEIDTAIGGAFARYIREVSALARFSAVNRRPD